jgi:hypothetical protein
MIAKTSILASLVLACALAFAAPLAAAQDNSAMHGQDSEFGSVRAPYTLDVNGQRANVEGHVILKNTYPDANSRFFMFGISVENSPTLDITFDHLIRTDTNKELPCVRPKEGDAHSSLRCFVDLKDLPSTGTEILIRGTVGASRLGTFQVGFPVIAFGYNYQKVKMNNGLEAELFGYSQVNVQKATAAESTGLAGMGNKVPAVGVAGVLGVGAVAAVLVGMRKRRG